MTIENQKDLDLIFEVPSTENKYQYILSLFTGPEEYRTWMHSPFVVGEYAVATNGITLSYIDKGLMPEVSHLKDKDPEEILSIIPKLDGKELIIISSERLKQEIKKCPVVDVTDEEECKCCEGFGEVDFEFYYNGFTYACLDSCPICDGDGFVEKAENVGKNKEYDLNTFCKIGNCTFYIINILKIYKVAKLLKEDHIKLVHQTAYNQCCVFQISDVMIIVMPALIKESDKLVFEIS